MKSESELAGLRAIILAGEKGGRLVLYTPILPKSFMLIGDMPILEIIIRQLWRFGGPGYHPLGWLFGQSAAGLFWGWEEVGE